MKHWNWDNLKRVLCLLLAVLCMVSTAAAPRADAASAATEPAGAAEGTPPTASKNSEAAASSPFADVTEKDWAYNFILRVFQEGIMIGTYYDPESGVRNFGPDQQVTMAEWSVIIARIFYAVEADNRPETEPYEREIAVLTYHNAYEGAGELEQGDVLTRYQTAQILYNAARDLGVKMPTGDALRLAEQRIADWDRIPETYQRAVGSLIALEVFSGGDGGNFFGNRTLSRREAATVVCMSLDHLFHSTAGTISYTSVSLSLSTHHWVTDYWANLPSDLRSKTNQDAFNCAAQTAADANLIRYAGSYDGRFNSRYNYACYSYDVKQPGTANVVQAALNCTGFYIGTGGSKSTGYVDYFTLVTPDSSEESAELFKDIADSFPEDATDREKATACIEALCGRLDYQEGALASWAGEETKAGMDSFSDMLAVLLSSVNIPSITVRAEVQGGTRTWLQVRLGDSWYVIDAAAAEQDGMNRAITTFYSHSLRYGYSNSVNNADDLEIARCILSYWPASA